MTIFKEDKKTGLQCGVNDYGELFVGNERSGYNLPDTDENRERVLNDFDYWNKDKNARLAFELVVIWETGEKEVHAYATEEEARAAGDGYKMAFGNQISWTGTRKAATV